MLREAVDTLLLLAGRHDCVEPTKGAAREERWSD